MLKNTSTLLAPAKPFTGYGTWGSGTGHNATICVSLQLTTVADNPLK